jgi:hypothetical protein
MLHRGDLFVLHIDKGTWKQNTNGIVSLLSEIRLPDVICGGLTIRMITKEKVIYLPALKQAIRSFLDTRQEEVFSKSMIENIMRINSSPIISVFLENSSDKISRRQLEPLIVKIDEYLEKGMKQEIFLNPMQYRGVKFLHWHNAEGPLNNDIKSILNIIDNNSNKENPEDIFTLIDFSGFKRATQDKAP